MASAELSRRVERVVGYPLLSELGELQRREFHEALLEAATFEDLPGEWQAATGSAAPGLTGAVSWGSRTVSPPSTASFGSRAPPTAARSSPRRSPSAARPRSCEANRDRDDGPRRRPAKRVSGQSSHTRTARSHSQATDPHHSAARPTRWPPRCRPERRGAAIERFADVETAPAWANTYVLGPS